jgi:hypothetical protein
MSGIEPDGVISPSGSSSVTRHCTSIKVVSPVTVVTKYRDVGFPRPRYGIFRHPSVILIGL